MNLSAPIRGLSMWPGLPISVMARRESTTVCFLRPRPRNWHHFNSTILYWAESHKVHIEGKGTQTPACKESWRLFFFFKLSVRSLAQPLQVQAGELKLREVRWRVQDHITYQCEWQTGPWGLGPCLLLQATDSHLAAHWSHLGYFRNAHA